MAGALVNMKLLFAADYFPLRESGVFRIHDFIRFFKSFGVNVWIVSRMTVGDISKVNAGENTSHAKIHRALSLDLRLGHVVLDVFQITSTFLLCSIVSLLNDIDLIIISVPPGVPAIGAFFSAKILRRKVMFDVRDKWEDHSIYFSKYRLIRWNHVILKKLFDVFYRKAEMVVSVTPSLVKYLKMRGCPEVGFIPNGADVGLFHPRASHEKSAIRSELGLDEGDIVLVYAGSLGGYYRTDIVIRAMDHLQKTNYIFRAKFLIMGKGEPSEIREMLKLIRNLALEKSVIFLGEQRRENVARILACCDLGVVPYDDNALWASAYSTKFFEYCSSGLPVVVTVTKDSDLAMLVRKHEVGYVVDPLDVIQFATVVKEFCSLSEKEKKEMGSRARSLVVGFFDRRAIAKKLIEHLQRI